jgi:hypothetical protein
MGVRVSRAEKLVSRVRKKNQVLAFVLGLRLVQEYC